MVRCASGVTTMMHLPVGVSSAGAPGRKETPTARQSWPKTRPRSSSLTLPMYAAVPPNEAIPDIVLAAAPPLISMAPPSAWYRYSARSVSIRVIDPFTKSCLTMKSSSAWAMTSTNALPIPTTSYRMPGTWVQATGHSCRGYAPLVSDNPYRLPQTVVPSRYRLMLEPDLAGATFSGTVSIDVTARDSVDLVKLNVAELDIASVRVNDNDTGFHLEPATERLVVEAPLDAGDAVIEIAFTGI